VDRGKADIFIAVMHHGDGMDKTLGDFLAKLPAAHRGAAGGCRRRRPHALRQRRGVRRDSLYPSGANGRLFGLIQLVMRQDPPPPALDRSFANAQEGRNSDRAGTVPVPGEAVSADAKVASLIADARQKIDSLAVAS